ncbi:hypothetical protein T484DRAFT_2023599, partial [Baffinella frigidus]
EPSHAWDHAQSLPHRCHHGRRARRQLQDSEGRYHRGGGRPSGDCRHRRLPDARRGRA